MYSKKVLEKSGLMQIGCEEDGILTYMGTEKQWKKAEELQSFEEFEPINSVEAELTEINHLRNWIDKVISNQPIKK